MDLSPIVDAVYEQQRNQRQERGLPARFTVGVIGLGELSSTLLNAMSLDPNIGEILAYNRSPEKTEGAALTHLSKVTPIFEDNVSELRARAHIIFIGVRDSQIDLSSAENREYALSSNIFALSDVQAKLSGTNALIHNWTNPTDLTTAAFVANGQFHPLAVLGGTHVDTYRFKYLLLMDLMQKYTLNRDQRDAIYKNLEAYVIGPHDKSLVALAREAKISEKAAVTMGFSKQYIWELLMPDNLTTRNEKLIWRKNWEDTISEKVKLYHTKLLGIRRSTHHNSGMAADEVMQATMNETSVVTVSFPHKMDNGNLIFFGYPVRFKGLVPIPQKIDIDAEHREELGRAAGDLENKLQYMEKQKLIYSIPKSFELSRERIPITQELMESRFEILIRKPVSELQKRLHIVCTTGYRVLEYTLQRSNSPREIELTDIVKPTALHIADVNGKTMMFVGNKEGVFSYLIEANGIKKHEFFSAESKFNRRDPHSVRNISSFGNHLVFATRSGIYSAVISPESKSGKIRNGKMLATQEIQSIHQIYCLEDEIIVAGSETAILGSDHLLEKRTLVDSANMESVCATYCGRELIVFGIGPYADTARKISAHVNCRLSRWNTKSQDLPVIHQEPFGLTGKTKIAYAETLGNQFIFISGQNPEEIWTYNPETLKRNDNLTFEKPGGGIGALQAVADRGEILLIAGNYQDKRECNQPSIYVFDVANPSNQLCRLDGLEKTGTRSIAYFLEK